MAAAACMVTPAAARPLLPTPCFAGCPSERSGWDNKKPGRASASKSWTKDKLVARTSAAVPGRASLSDNWTKDKIERKEASAEQRVGRALSREKGPIGGKRASSRALSVEAERSEKKAKPEEEDAKVETKPDEDVEAVFYAGPSFIKSPDPSELPIPWFLMMKKAPKTALNN